jgi:hypothetical protein
MTVAVECERKHRSVFALLLGWVGLGNVELVCVDDGGAVNHG